MEDRITHSVEQGSKAWLTLREDYFVASEAPVVLGHSKYKKRDALLLEKLTGEREEVSDFTKERFEAGHTAEELARPIAEVAAGCTLEPVVFTRGKWLASLDGFNQDAGLIFEHKLLNKTNVAIEKDQDLPPEYWPQVEHQMLVAGVDRCLFVVSDGSPRDGKYFSIVYQSKRERRARVVAGWTQFEKDLATADVAELRKLQVIETDDADLLDLSNRIVAAQAVADQATAALEELKDEFKERVGDQATKAGDVTVSFRDTPRTDYNGMCKHYGIDKSVWTKYTKSKTLRVNK